MYCTENLTERLAIGFADFMKMENIIPVFTPVEVKEENEPVLFIIRETANRLHGTLFYYFFFFTFSQRAHNVLELQKLEGCENSGEDVQEQKRRMTTILLPNTVVSEFD